MLQWTLGCMCLFELWFSLGICPVVGLLGHMVILFFKKTFIFYFYLFIYWLHHVPYGISVSQPGIEPGPRQWKPWILTTKPPGNSHYFNYLRDLHTVFHNGCTNLHSTNSVQEFPFLHILANVCYFCSFWW